MQVLFFLDTSDSPKLTPANFLNHGQNNVTSINSSKTMDDNGMGTKNVLRVDKSQSLDNIIRKYFPNSNTGIDKQVMSPNLIKHRRATGSNTTKRKSQKQKSSRNNKERKSENRRGQKQTEKLDETSTSNGQNKLIGPQTTTHRTPNETKLEDSNVTESSSSPLRNLATNVPERSMKETNASLDKELKEESAPTMQPIYRNVTEYNITKITHTQTVATNCHQEFKKKDIDIIEQSFTSVKFSPTNHTVSNHTLHT